MFQNEMTFILDDPDDLESMHLSPICPACKTTGPGRDQNGVALWGVVPTLTGLWLIHNQCIDEWNERAQAIREAEAKRKEQQDQFIKRRREIIEERRAKMGDEWADRWLAAIDRWVERNAKSD